MRSFCPSISPINIQKRLQKLGKLWSLLTRNIAGLSKNLELRFRGHMVLCIHGTPQKLVVLKTPVGCGTNFGSLHLHSQCGQQIDLFYIVTQFSPFDQ